MANPHGINQMDRFGGELPYGDVKKLEELKRAAPLAGVMPGSNAPQNAQRKAVRGPSRPRAQEAQAPVPAAPPTNVRPEVIASETWKALLDSDPLLANDPLVQWYANG